MPHTSNFNFSHQNFLFSQLYNLASGVHFKDERELRTDLLSLDENVAKKFDEIFGIVRNGISASHNLRLTTNVKTKGKRRNRQKVEKREESENDSDKSEELSDKDDEAEVENSEGFSDLNNRFALLLS